MEDKIIQQNNRKIAEFLGWPPDLNYDFDDNYNFIFKVVDYICEEKRIDKDGYKFIIDGNTCYIQKAYGYQWGIEPSEIPVIIKETGKTRIEGINKAVLKFINWYNNVTTRTNIQQH